MRSAVRFALLLLAAVLLAGFVWVLTAPGEWVGKPAPPTQGTDADGVAFRLGDYRGKVVMLDFWGGW